MCIICVELIGHKMTIPEAISNLGEIASNNGVEDLNVDHEKELLVALEDLDIAKIDKLITEGADDKN